MERENGQLGDWNSERWTRMRPADAFAHQHYRPIKAGLTPNSSISPAIVFGQLANIEAIV